VAEASRHEASLIYIIGRVNQGVRRQMQTALAQWGLSVQEFTTLSVLSARPGLSNAQLSRRALVTPQSMIEILARLESRGLVEREVDPAHKRILRAQLTKSGVRLIADAEPEIEAIQDGMLVSLTPTERRAVTRAMRTAMENLSDAHLRVS
jgi:DNA-binding MarR family transcriptional regulator